MAYFDQEDDRRATLGTDIPSAPIDRAGDGLQLLSGEWDADIVQSTEQRGFQGVPLGFQALLLAFQLITYVQPAFQHQPTAFQDNTLAFQMVDAVDAFQANAFQLCAFQISDGFQGDGFQINAFQMCGIAPSAGGGGGGGGAITGLAYDQTFARRRVRR